MIQIILLLLGLAFGNQNTATSANDSNGQVTTLTTDSGDGTDTGDEGGGPVGGNSGQLPPPPFSQP